MVLPRIKFILKKKLSVFLIAFSVCILYSYAHAQNITYRFENITSGEGLAGSTVNAIIQDALGFIWIGSEEGLTRLDGYSCLTYRHESGSAHSLSDNEVYAMCTDGKGDLWIGTRHGLNRYDIRNDRFETFFHDSSDTNSLAHNEIFALAKPLSSGQ